MTPEEALQERFPNMQPVKSPPTLFTWNGLGGTVYGKWGYDQETNTYLKAHCLCFLFIPVFFLAAYRVADAERGWYFIGKEPLPAFNKMWNYSVLVAMLMGVLAIGWSIHTDSAEYKAGQEMALAHKLENQGELVEAAGAYNGILRQYPSVSEEAKAGLIRVANLGLESSSAEVAGSMLSILSRDSNKNLVPNLFDRGLALIDRHVQQSPKESLAMLRIIEKLSPQNPVLPELNRGLLKNVVARYPDDMESLAELSELYMKDGDEDACLQLLMPRKDKLGSTEGARILGQLLMARGKHTEAYPLLVAYVDKRMAAMRQAEASYEREVDAAQERALKYLQDGRANQSFYDAYDKASENRKQELVNEQISQRMDRDGAFQNAVQQYRETAKIVPVALNLGIAQLNRAQDMEDADARKNELEAAEKTFLSIQGAAGESDEYRLFLGQVYYWLGRFHDGKVLFDELLAANNREPDILLSLAHTLRDVGEQTQARSMAEEAFNKAATQDEKDGAAVLRALLRKDSADEVAWLERANTNSVGMQIQLAYARGGLAMENGDTARAIIYMRQAAQGYENLPKAASSLNNGGLAYLSLYSLSGNPADHLKGSHMLEEAVAMEPSNSILQSNTADSLMNSAIISVIGDRMKAGALGRIDLDMLRNLYKDEAERSEIMERLRQSEDMASSLDHLDKAILLSPKTAGHYAQSFEVQSYFQDLAALKALEQRIRKASLDLSEAAKTTRERYAGVIDPKDKTSLQKGMKLLEDDLKKQAIRSHAPSLAYAKCLYVRTSLGATALGIPADVPQMLRLAQEAQASNDSSMTVSILGDAYLHAAHADLASKSSEYARLANPLKLSLGIQSTLTGIMEKNPRLKGQIARHPHVLKALELMRLQDQRFPANPNVSDWAFFREVDPAAANEIAERVRGSEINRESSLIAGLLNPLSGEVVMHNYWMAQLDGDAAGAQHILDEGKAQGIPLP